MSRIDDVRNALYQRLLDAAGAPLTRRWVRRVGGALARWRRNKARRRAG